MWRYGLAGFASLSGLASLSFLERNKHSGRLQVILIPEFLENYIGKLAKLTLKNNFALEQSEPAHQCVHELCSVLTTHVDIKKEWNVQVLKDTTINAFVLPDGSIFVCTGLLELLESVDELGFVLSHELSHVILRHSSEKISIGGLLAIFWLIVQVYFTGDMDLTYIGNLLIRLPLSRTAETEADMHAVLIMKKIGLNPEAGISVMEKFTQKLPEGKLEILSTHPLSKNRAECLEEQILEHKQEKFPEDPQIKKLRALFSRAKAELESKPPKVRPVS